MKINFHMASFGKAIEIDGTINSQAESMPDLSVACGRGAQVSAASGILSVWFVERGCVQVNSAGLALLLSEGQMFVNVDSALKLKSVGDATWIGLSMPVTVARQVISEASTSGIAMQSFMDQTDSEIRKINALLLSQLDDLEGAGFDSYLNLVRELFRLESKSLTQLKNSPGRTEQLRKLSYQRMAKARAYIAACPCHVDRIKVIAEIASYSEGHFIRTFSKIFGETPLDYAHRLRIAYAKQLINESRLSLAEISRELGFVTFSAFCRSFRISTGTTPSAFRMRDKFVLPSCSSIERSFSAH